MTLLRKDGKIKIYAWLTTPRKRHLTVYFQTNKTLLARQPVAIALSESGERTKSTNLLTKKNYNYEN